MASTPPHRRVLVFCKVPEAGGVKTRLCPPLSPEAAAELMQAFIEDTFRTLYRPERWRLTAAFTPADHEDKLRHLLPAGVDCWPQPGGDLGERLLAANQTFATTGPVVIVGSDSPDLPLSRIEVAFQLLESGIEVVLGPTRDGGYYLIGVRQTHPELFVAVPWSTCDVLGVTLSRARDAGITLELLEPWEDVDRPEDLDRLRERLKDSAPTIAPRTRGLLERGFACAPEPHCAGEE